MGEDQEQPAGIGAAGQEKDKEVGMVVHHLPASEIKVVAYSPLKLFLHIFSASTWESSPAVLN